MGWFKSQMWKVLEWTDNTSNTIVYKFPMDGKEIMRGSKLTVRESQVAIFVDRGRIADVFQPGDYKLDAVNLPILSGLNALLYQDKKAPFKSDLYFVNTKQFPNQKWGTKNPITMRDNEFGMIRIKAFGTYSFRVTDPSVFLKELFGTNSTFTVDSISDYLKSLVLSQIADTIAESNISALDMASNYQEFGNLVENYSREKFAKMGLNIVAFNVENINFPEAVEKAIDERTSLGILGGSMGAYTQKKTADAIGDAAKNTGTAGAFFGMGVAQNLGATMFGATQSATSQKEEPKQKQKYCAECGAQIGATAKFCPECGTKQSQDGKCPSCGAEVKKGAKFCPECGQKI